MAVTAKEFNEFFQSKRHAPYKCPVCGHGAFAVNVQAAEEAKPPPDQNVAVLGVLGTDGATFTPIHHDFLSFSCTNCGHTDFFHINQFKAWLQATHGRSDV